MMSRKKKAVMSNKRKIKVGSMTDLTINRLATVVNVLIQYPHKKIRVTQSCGTERKLKIMAGTIP